MRRHGLIASPVFLQDDFIGADGASPNLDIWTITAGGTAGWTILGNRLRGDADASAAIILADGIPDEFGQEILAVVEATADNDAMRAILRAADPNNYYAVQFNATNVTVMQRKASVETSLGVLGGSTGMANGERRFVRFQTTTATDGVHLRARQWVEGNAEPSTWQADLLDNAGDQMLSGVPGFRILNAAIFFVDRMIASRV